MHGVSFFGLSSVFENSTLEQCLYLGAMFKPPKLSLELGLCLALGLGSALLSALLEVQALVYDPS